MRTLFDSLLTRIGALSVIWIIILLTSAICSTSSWAVRDSCYGTTETEDGAGRSAAPANSYGGSTSLTGDKFDITKLLLRPLNVSTKLGAGATITACTLYFNVSSTNNGKIVSAHRVFKPWPEGTASAADPGTNPGATWVCWDADSDDSSGWGTAGCENASDAGSDNSSKGSGNDRKVTAEGTVTLGASTGYYKVVISNALAQAWYDGTAATNGVCLSTNASGAWFITTSENASGKPYFVFEYTTSGGAALPSAIYKQGVSGLIYKAGESGKRSKP